MPDHDDVQVTYTVRELLARIEATQAAGFARMEASMASKADKADVARLETRLDAHAKALDEHSARLGKVEGEEHDRKVASGVHEERDARAWTWRQKIAGGIATVLLILATASPYLSHVI